MLARDSGRAADARSIAGIQRIRSRRCWLLGGGREPAHRGIAIPPASHATVLRGGVAATRNTQIVTALRHGRGGTRRIRDGAFRGRHGGRRRRQARGPDFRCGHRAVLDQLGLTQLRDLLRQSGSLQARKFGYRVDVDVERIEELAAVRRIRARLVRAIIEQGVQRIERDTGRAPIGGKLDQTGKIRKIAVTPIALRANAVELRRQHPYASRAVALVGPFRRDQKGRVLLVLAFRRADVYPQPECPNREVARQCDMGAAAFSAPEMGVSGNLPTDFRAGRRLHSQSCRAAVAKHDGGVDEAPGHVTTCRQQLDEVRDRVAVRNAFVSKGIAISRLNAPPSRALRNPFSEAAPSG